MFDVPYYRSYPIVPSPVNLFLSMEAGNNNDLVTTIILNAATIGSGGSWSISPSPLTSFKVSTAFDGGALLNPITIGGITYFGNGGNRSFVYDHNIDANYCQYTVTTNSKIVSVGFWHQTNLHNPINPSSVQIDLLVITGVGASANAAAVLQFFDAENTEDGIRSHGSSTNTGTTFGNVIPTVVNTKYWVTLQYNSVTGLVHTNVYTEIGEQVGSTSSCAIDIGNDVVQIYFGANNHSILQNKFTYFDNIIIDWVNGVFPLGV